MDQNAEFEAIKDRHKEDIDELIYEGFYSRPDEAITDRATLITLVESERARADKAEADLAHLRILIECVAANCEASGSSYQERIETIHQVTSAYALMWEDARAVGEEG